MHIWLLTFHVYPILCDLFSVFILCNEGTTFTKPDDLIKKYKNAKANLAYLKVLGASLLHGVDATKMRILPVFQWKKFHRIIFNFPHAGFYGREDNPDLIT